MKILNFSKFYPPYKGGIEKVAVDLTEGLNSKNIDTTVLCFDSEDSEASYTYEVQKSKVIANIKSTPISISNIFDYYKLAKEVDLVHVHFPNPMANLSIFFTWYVFNVKPKIVVHWHSDIVKQKYILLVYKLLMNWLLKRCDSIVCTSKKYFESSHQLLDFKDKVEIIPIGIDTHHLNIDRDIYNNIKNSYSGKKIVFTLGRHVYYKGYRYLIESLCGLNEDIVVIIGGTGPLTDELKALVKELGVSDKVVFVGRIPDEHIGAYYSSCDIYCMPSIERSEAFGVVQLEAMFFGKPIISTRIKGSGVDWVNMHMESGLTVDTHNPTQLASAINLLSSDTALYKELSEGAKKRFHQHFDVSVMSRSFERLYRKILN
ncbi:glycosyltransferase [Photobacterium rosenbergii]|uniref:glycosyltransferase n=1 Tax=Photobacterium rosenbergii TaxID=294936 RepID=UPI001C9A0141|nr:glycosyltransferase [Photobacterium rosenbergii]MBY5947417.1 glycosyltransferase [Photobacterium rosenbergii]